MCKVEGCERPAETRMGYCVMHYKRFIRNGTTDRVLQSYGAAAQCEFCGTKGKLRKGLCNACRVRQSRKGYIERDIAPKGSGTINSAGYRVITVRGERVYEHREVMGAKPGEVVHHTKGKADNAFEDLVVFPSQSEHMKHHHALKKED